MPAQWCGAIQFMPKTPETLSFRVSSGTLRAHRFGPQAGPLLVCIHGLSANSRSFDFLAEELAAQGRNVVALDLRGRGWSDVTGPGSYGWANHAQDVLEVATALGADRFDYVGHSMGAFIGMEVARRAKDRVTKLALVDAVGVPEARALEPIFAAVKRLGAVYKDADAYIATVRHLGTVEPWSDYWETHYRYDLVPVAGGVSSRTNRDAVVEDLKYGGTQLPGTMWSSLTADCLLVRSGRSLGGGYVVKATDRDRFVKTAPRAKAIDIDANHYGVMTHADTADAIVRFMS
jgi:pimeloyl-ACP methyl ester carboxylesterase